MGTRATSRSSGTCATPRSPRSTKGRTRSSGWSLPNSCSASSDDLRDGSRDPHAPATAAARRVPREFEVSRVLRAFAAFLALTALPAADAAAGVGGMLPLIGPRFRVVPSAPELWLAAAFAVGGLGFALGIRAFARRRNGAPVGQHPGAD